MLKIRRPLGRLIFNMGIAIPGKTVFLIETAPWGSPTHTLLATVNWWFMQAAGPGASPIRPATCIVPVYCINISDIVTFTAIWSKSLIVYATKIHMCKFWPEIQNYRWVSTSRLRIKIVPTLLLNKSFAGHSMFVYLHTSKVIFLGKPCHWTTTFHLCYSYTHISFISMHHWVTVVLATFITD